MRKAPLLMSFMEMQISFSNNFSNDHSVAILNRSNTPIQIHHQPLSVFIPQINCVTFPSPIFMAEQQLLKPDEWSYCDYFWVSFPQGSAHSFLQFSFHSILNKMGMVTALHCSTVLFFLQTCYKMCKSYPSVIHCHVI